MYLYMEKYCKFEKYYKEPTINYNIISACLFLLDKPYKDSVEYFNGLQIVVDNFRNIFGEDWYLRVYYDDTVLIPSHKNDNVNKLVLKHRDYIDKLKQNKSIQMIKFNCPTFKKDKDDICHLGLFGTIIRFYPLFDFKDNSNINHVIVIDTDINTVNNLYLYKKIHDFITKNYKQVRIYGKYRPTIGKGTDSRKMNKIWILAGTIQLYGKKFDSNVLLNFFKKLAFGDNSDILKYIETYLLEYKQENKGIFSYGIDEYFYNMYIIPELTKNKEIYSYMLGMSFAWVFYAHYFLNNKYNGLDAILKKNIEKMYKYIMGKYYDDKKSLSVNYDIFDDRIYTKYDRKFIKYALIKFKDFLFNTIREEYEQYGFDKETIRYANILIKTEGKLTIVINNYPNRENKIMEFLNGK